MDGANRNFNTQAVDIRIQIEQAKLGRELTPQEKNEIVESQLKRGNAAGGPIQGARPSGNAMQQAGQQAEAAIMAREGNRGAARAIIEENKVSDSERSFTSSDEEDWNDPGYVEEQR